jgi:hypothetical protein
MNRLPNSEGLRNLFHRIESNPIVVKFEQVKIRATTGNVLWLVLMLFSAAGHAQSAQGRFDVSHHNFSEGAVALSGPWEFYWNKLLTPADFNIDQQPEWFHVPGSCIGRVSILR